MEKKHILEGGWGKKAENFNIFCLFISSLFIFQFFYSSRMTSKKENKEG